MRFVQAATVAYQPMEKIVLGDALDLAEFPDDVTKLRQQMVGVRQDIDQLFEATDVGKKSTHQNTLRIDAHGRTNLIVQLATLTILIDRDLISIDDAVGRIEQIEYSLADQMPGFADPMVRAGVKRATDWLRSNKREPRPRRKLALVSSSKPENI